MEATAILLAGTISDSNLKARLQRWIDMEKVDVIIVGSGAGGGPLASVLSAAGLHVAVLEKGPRYSREHYLQDELLASDELGFFVPSIDEEPHVLIGKEGRPERSTLGWIACCVGGGTSHMGASLYRFHPTDFEMRSTFGEYCGLADWPYSYADLERYYSQAEWAVGVSGLPGLNPFEGPRSASLPLPPLPAHPISSLFDSVCVQLGCHPFPTPRAINSQPYDGRPECADCTMCAGLGCPSGARGSTQETVLAAAERTGRCKIFPKSMVREISVLANGRVDGCIYLDEKKVERRISARIICVCCSAVESARLLLLSKSPLFPDGLANGTGLVGRNLQFLATSRGTGRFKYNEHLTADLRAPSNNIGRSVMDHYFLPSAVSDLAKGGLLRFDMARPAPIADAQRLARLDSGSLDWGESLKQRLREYFLDAREIEFEIFHDFIPVDGSFVELDPEVQDKWGLPVARIHLAETEHQKAAGRWLVGRGMEILEAMGADDMKVLAEGLTGRNLVHGTCRAGKSARNSVLNEFCQAHEVPNLFVVDGSFLPTSGGAPSTLTILANSFRTADQIIEKLKAGEFN
jgi:choline dehydrogenase-like flavoprotein